MLARVRQALALHKRLRRRRRAKLALEAERAFFRAMLDLSPEDIVIDCGANVGDYAAHLARSGAQAHCFEPDPVAFAALSARLATAPNVTLHARAVGARAGRATLRRPAGFDADPLRMTVGSSLMAGNTGGDVAVDVVDLVGFIAALPRKPAIVKIDIEGAEVEVLEALHAAGLLGACGLVFVETHEWLYPELVARTLALVDLVAARPYRTVNLDWG